MSPTVLLLGAGGHGRVLLDALRRLGLSVTAALDQDSSRHGSTIAGVPVIGADEMLREFPPNTVRLVNGIGSTGDCRARRVAFERLGGAGYQFLTIVDPTAFVAADCELGEGSQILAGAVIQPGCRIGANTIVNTRASLDHDCHVGRHAHIAPGAVLCGMVELAEEVHVGAGAVVRQSIRIGARTLIGLGAAVVGDIPADCQALGVPARAVPRLGKDGILP